MTTARPSSTPPPYGIVFNWDGTPHGYSKHPHFTPADQIAVALDGRDLGSPETRNTATVNPDNPSDVAEHSWMVWSLAPAQVDQGMHEIRVYVVARNPRLQPPLVVENVEIHINY